MSCGKLRSTRAIRGGRLSGMSVTIPMAETSSAVPTPLPTLRSEPARQPGEAELIALLALVYRSVDWRAQGGRSVLDRWSGMVLVASRAETVGEFVSSLCARLGVGSLASDAVELLAACHPYEAALLDWVAREHIPVAMMAYAAAKERRA